MRPDAHEMNIDANEHKLKKEGLWLLLKRGKDV
jgi:hypothetical protein